MFRKKGRMMKIRRLVCASAKTGAFSLCVAFCGLTSFVSAGDFPYGRFATEEEVKAARDSATVDIVAKNDFTGFFATTEHRCGGVPMLDRGQIISLLRDAVKNKDTLSIHGLVLTDILDQSPSADAFRFVLLPDLWDCGFKRIIYTDAENFLYDSSKDHFMSARDAYYSALDKAKEQKDREAGQWESEPPYYEKFKLKEGEPRDENDLFERRGFMSLKKLKELGEAGDDASLLFYAECHLREGYMSSVMEDFADVREAVRALDILAARGNLRGISYLVDIYTPQSKKDEKKDTSGKRKPNWYIKHAEEFSKMADEKIAEKYKEMQYMCYEKLLEGGNANYLHYLSGRAQKRGDLETLYGYFKKYDDWYSNGMLTALCFGKKSGLWPVKSYLRFGGCPPKDFINLGHFLECLGSEIGIADEKIAFEVAQKIAEKNPYSEDVLILAHMYLNGIGTEKNPEAAFKLAQTCFFSRCPDDSVVAAAYLAYAYEKGIGTPADEDKARYLWLRCEQFNNPNLWGAVAARLYDGFGMPKDRERAVEILEERLGGSRGEKRLYLEKLVKIFGGEFDPSERNEGKLKLYSEQLEELKREAVSEKKRSAKD